MPKKMRLDKKGFTIVELWVGFITSAVIILAVSQLFSFYHSFVKNTGEEVNKRAEIQLALKHIVDNIQNSAWVKVTINTIELHSHSYPHIRKYAFVQAGSPNEGYYLEYTPDSLADEAAPEILARGIDGTGLMVQSVGVDPITEVVTTEFFKGEGVPRPGNCFNLVRIEFWNKKYPNDVAYAIAGSKERTGLTYVTAGVSSAYEDGTKAFPYSSLKVATDSIPLLLSETLYDSSYPHEIVAILAGEQVFSGEWEMVNQNLNIVFCPASTATFNPGCTLTLGPAARMILTGEVYCKGAPGERITIQAERGEPGADPWSVPQWDMIFVTNGSPGFSQYDFQYLNISGGWDSIRFRKTSSSPMEVTFANNYVDGVGSCFSAGNVKTLTLYNNHFAPVVSWQPNFSVVLDTGGYYGDTIETGDLSYTINNNTFGRPSSYDSWTPPLLDTLLYNQTAQQKLTMKIDRNSFGGPLDFTSTFYNLQGEVTNNIVDTYASWYGAIGVYGYFAWQSYPDAYLLIKNNTLDGDQSNYSDSRGHAGIALGPPAVETTIQNNEIKSFVCGIGQWSGTASDKKVIIRNNIIHDNRDAINSSQSLFSVYGGYGCDMDIMNNIIYNSGRIYYVPGAYSVISFDPVTGSPIPHKGTFKAAIVNNTLAGIRVDGDPAKMSINNSIIWGNAGLVNTRLLTNNTTNSDVQGSSTIAIGPAKNVKDVNPVFVSVGGQPYHITSAECLVLGRDKDGNPIEAGAYGGDYKDGWNEPVGAPADGTVGANL